ncbi:MAG: hypothetical protein ABNG97_09720 [Sulfitobacter sp.]|jgi:hypothetical protein
MIFVLADRLGKFPDEIRDMPIEDFIAFGAYLEILEENRAQ